MWALLIVTLPTRPNAVRLRIWRALKALGCAALRDGAYLLPAAQAAWTGGARTASVRKTPNHRPRAPGFRMRIPSISISRAEAVGTYAVAC